MVAAVGGADAGGDPEAGGGIDGQGVGRAPLGGVDRRLGGQVQGVADRPVHGDKEHPPAVVEHEIDHFGGAMLGGANQVALVLAGFIVGQHDHLARTKVVQNVGDVMHGSSFNSRIAQSLMAHWGRGRRPRRLGVTETRRKAGGELKFSVADSAQAVFEDGNFEVDDQADLELGGFQVSQRLPLELL